LSDHFYPFLVSLVLYLTIVLFQKANCFMNQIIIAYFGQ